MSVGRVVERAFVDILAAEAGAGLSRTLVVRGEPGTGKGLLLAHLVAGAAAAGWLVVTAAEHGPSLGAAVGVPGPDGSTSVRALPPHAVRARLEALAADRPLLLVVADLHRADADTVAVIGHLVRLPPRGRVLLAVSLCPGEASDDVLRAVRAGADGDGPHVVELGRPAAAGSRPAPWAVGSGRG